MDSIRPNQNITPHMAVQETALEHMTPEEIKAMNLQDFEEHYTILQNDSSIWTRLTDNQKTAINTKAAEANSEFLSQASRDGVTIKSA